MTKQRVFFSIKKIRRSAVFSRILIAGVVALFVGLAAANLYRPTLEVSAAGADDFVTTWRVAGDATGRTVAIPTFKNPSVVSNQPYNYTIDWGDGTIEAFTDSTTPLHQPAQLSC